jgi:hypothetical protein
VVCVLITAAGIPVPTLDCLSFTTGGIHSVVTCVRTARTRGAIWTC